MGIGKALKSAADYICDHSGTICAGVAVAGVGATAYFSGKAAVRVDHELDCDMTRLERFKLYARCYWKTAVAGALTVGAIIGSDRLHVGKEVGLAAGLAVWKDKYMKLDNKLGEVAGDDIRNEVHREIVKDELQEETQSVKEYGDKKIIFYEPFTKQYIESTYAQYLEAMLETNFRFHIDDSVALSIPIDYMGGKVTTDSDNLMWDLDIEAQNYNFYSYGYGGSSIRLCEGSTKQLEYWLKTNKEQTEADAVTLLFNVDPEDIRLMEYNEKTGTLDYKEELPWE